MRFAGRLLLKALRCAAVASNVNEFFLSLLAQGEVAMDLKEITTQSKIPTIKVLQAAQKLTKNRKKKVREWRKWWNPSGPMVRTLILNDSNNDDDNSDDDNNDDDDSDDDDDDGVAFDNSVPLSPPRERWRHNQAPAVRTDENILTGHNLLL